MEDLRKLPFKFFWWFFFILPLIPWGRFFPKIAKLIITHNIWIVDRGGWFCPKATAVLLEYTFTIKNPMMRERMYKRLKFEWVEAPKLLMELDPVATYAILKNWPWSTKKAGVCFFRPFVFFNIMCTVQMLPYRDNGDLKGAAYAAEVFNKTTFLGDKGKALEWFKNMDRVSVCLVIERMVLFYGVMLLKLMKNVPIAELLETLEELQAEEIEKNDAKWLDKFKDEDGKLKENVVIETEMLRKYRGLNGRLFNKNTAKDILRKFDYERSALIKMILQELKNKNLRDARFWLNREEIEGPRKAELESGKNDTRAAQKGFDLSSEKEREIRRWEESWKKKLFDRNDIDEEFKR